MTDGHEPGVVDLLADHARGLNDRLPCRIYFARPKLTRLTLSHTTPKRKRGCELRPRLHIGLVSVSAARSIAGQHPFRMQIPFRGLRTGDVADAQPPAHRRHPFGIKTTDFISFTGAPPNVG